MWRLFGLAVTFDISVVSGFADRDFKPGSKAGA